MRLPALRQSLAVLATGCVLAAVLSVGTASADRQATITLTARITFEQLFHARQDGKSSAGDRFVIRVSLRDRLGHHIGTGQRECQGTIGGFGICTAIYQLPRGKIVAVGDGSFTAFFEGVIVGGTGLYEGGRGRMVVNQTNKAGRQQIIIFALILQ